MGLLGPLTAQALGRSPYDPDVISGEGEEDPHVPRQQYDHRGRPINPESKRINKDIIRSHNEVMLVVGVAEPENPDPTAELESKHQHDAYESSLGVRLIWATKRCVEMVGVFGINGMRQRVLVYKHYSQTPCWELYRAYRSNFSFSRDMLPGAPASLLANYIDRRFIPQWFLSLDRSFLRRCVDHSWTYLRLHLELFAAFQRLGLIRSTQLLPSWKYFVPFTGDSPIPAPPLMADFTLPSLLRWTGSALLSATPLLLWAMTQRLMKDWQPKIWQWVLSRLPSPIYHGRLIVPLPTEQPTNGPPAPESHGEPETEVQEEPVTIEDSGEDGLQSTPEESPSPIQQPEFARRQSVYSVAGGEDSDDDEHEVVGAALISFDVEATEATEMPPQGLWSAELRPTPAPEPHLGGEILPIYLSTMLTRLPALMAGKVITDSILRLSIAPCEAVALRFAAQTFCDRRNLPCSPILGLTLFSGVNMTWLVNFLGAELMHLALSGEIWSVFSALSQYFHRSEEEWEDFEGKDWGDFLGPFYSVEPLF